MSACVAPTKDAFERGKGSGERGYIDRVTAVDEALARFDDPQRSALYRTRDVIRRLLPTANECIAYGLPTWRIDGDSVVSIQGFARHNSVFPHSGSVIESLAPRLQGFEVTKGGIHFDLVTPFPAPLMRALIIERIRQINGSYPRASGEFKEFYDNGSLKAKGRKRSGELTGSWQWFRRDGSLMRTGSFAAGRQVGEWTTFERSGRVVKISDFGR